MYSFVNVGPGVYKFVMDESSMTYCRVGGHEHQPNIDYNDLGFFDPSGGPFIGIGYEVEGKPITRIFCENDTFFVEVA